MCGLLSSDDTQFHKVLIPFTVVVISGADRKRVLRRRCRYLSPAHIKFLTEFESTFQWFRVVCYRLWIVLLFLVIFHCADRSIQFNVTERMCEIVLHEKKNGYEVLLVFVYFGFRIVNWRSSGILMFDPFQTCVAWLNIMMWMKTYRIENNIWWIFVVWNNLKKNWVSALCALEKHLFSTRRRKNKCT